MKSSKFFARGAAAVMMSLGVLAPPAWATRDIIYDISPQSITSCSVGASCTGDSLGGFAHFVNIPFSQIYIYKQGIVSFDAELPANSRDFGNVTYFAPGYSPDANYQLGLVETNSYSGGAWGFVVNFYAADATVTLPTSEGVGTTPLFQFFIAPESPYSNTIGANFFYPGADPVAGALTGYNVFGTSNGVTNSNGLDYGASNFPITLTSDDGYSNFTATDAFHIVRNAVTPPATPGVPEPGTWAMMILGFGIIGARMRRTRLRTAFA